MIRSLAVDANHRKLRDQPIVTTKVVPVLPPLAKPAAANTQQAVSQFKQDFSADYKESYWTTVRSMRERVAGAEYVSYLTKFWKNYGRTGLAIHASLYLTTIGSCYIGISHFGGGAQALEYLKMIPWQWWQQTVAGLSPNASSLAMAVLIAESTDILRAPITIILARSLKKRRDARLAAAAAAIAPVTPSPPSSSTTNTTPKPSAKL